MKKLLVLNTTKELKPIYHYVKLKHFLKLIN